MCVPPGQVFVRQIPRGHAVLVYLVEGVVDIIEGQGRTASLPVPFPRLGVFQDGDVIQLGVRDQPVRLLVMSAMPLGEPVVRYGPFVMNTQEEID